MIEDIPVRHLFRQPSMRKILAPNFQLTQAVRTGNLAKFNEILAMFGAIGRGEAGEREQEVESAKEIADEDFDGFP